MGRYKGEVKGDKTVNQDGRVQSGPRQEEEVEWRIVEGRSRRRRPRDRRREDTRQEVAMQSQFFCAIFFLSPQGWLGLRTTWNYLAGATGTNISFTISLLHYYWDRTGTVPAPPCLALDSAQYRLNGLFYRRRERGRILPT